MIWKMPAPCGDCPFSDSEAGKHLAASLHPGRIPEIKAGLAKDGHFICHKTTDETGDGRMLVCAGALQYQHDNNLSCQLERVMERLEAIHDR